MYTQWSANVGGLAQLAGSIETGKRADFIVLGEDPFELPVEALKDVKPLETWIGGKRAFSF
jgi:predicted amidohydrolase YtcJ